LEEAGLSVPASRGSIPLPGIGALSRRRIWFHQMNTPRISVPQVSGFGGRALGRLLKEWRGRRGYSQLDLALAARTTQRHLSFIESGRAAPSRDMVLRLAATMDLPLRQQNALLLAAGFAPAWRERDLSAPGLEVVNRALDYILAQHEPFPAFVVDRRWNLLRANRGAVKMTEFLAGPAADEAGAEPVNLAMALMSPDGLRPLIVNWLEVALYFLRGIQADADADGTAETSALLRRLLALPDVPSLSEVLPPEEDQSPVLPIHFRRGETSLRLFTTIATLGTPREVTLEEVRIECFFPMDDAAEAICRGWAMQS
jgi:transcriptional regulator with XRE-family HTH domain